MSKRDKQRYQQKYYKQRKVKQQISWLLKSSLTKGNWDNIDEVMGGEYNPKTLKYDSEVVNLRSKKGTTRNLIRLGKRREINILYKAHRQVAKDFWREKGWQIGEEPTHILTNATSIQMIQRRINKGMNIHVATAQVQKHLGTRTDRSVGFLGELREKFVIKKTGLKMKSLTPEAQEHFIRINRANPMRTTGKRMSQKEGYLYMLWLQGRGYTDSGDDNYQEFQGEERGTFSHYIVKIVNSAMKQEITEKIATLEKQQTEVKLEFIKWREELYDKTQEKLRLAIRDDEKAPSMRKIFSQGWFKEKQQEYKEKLIDFNISSKKLSKKLSKLK